MAGGGVRRAQDKKETGDGDKSCHCQVDCRRRSSSPPPSLQRRRLAPCFALCIHADVPMRHSLLCETRSSLFTPRVRRARSENGGLIPLPRRGNSLFCNGRLNWHVSGWSVFEARRKERKEAARLCLPFRQASHFHERKFTRLSFCSGFKGAALNRLLPPSFLIRFPTLVSILARRATSATSHDVWASCDLAAIVGIISMSSSHPAPLPFLLLLLFFLVPFPRAGDA